MSLILGYEAKPEEKILEASNNQEFSSVAPGINDLDETSEVNVPDADLFEPDDLEDVGNMREENNIRAGQGEAKDELSVSRIPEVEDDVMLADEDEPLASVPARYPESHFASNSVIRS